MTSDRAYRDELIDKILRGEAKDVNGRTLKVGDKVRLAANITYGAMFFAGNRDELDHNEKLTIEKIRDDLTLVFKEVPDHYGPFKAIDFIRIRFSPGRPLKKVA